ncbi:4-alpha-glucanotransferase [Halogranum rubrum]|uniref:4-alpha-glucanotransferase n=1 Tax=Halogranum rubrum TaxID=553466 RepID=A0A1I4I9H5_9EURY|nr:4-alpha-glucanotransferase [Halogranum rubrum]SFL50960.1 4-alpha-glucanotransferase [Halogranum rubrum]
MRFDRQSGVFMHVTSLPGPHGIGDLGDGAYAFVDFLADADQSLWQVCPLGPTSAAMGNSPYQAYSAFAGNPLLVSLERLVDAGYLTDDDLEPVPEAFDPHETNYGAVDEYKKPLLRTAFERFEESASDEDREAFEAFCEREAEWLDGYALFMSLKEEFDGALWTQWPHDVKVRDESALDEYREKLADDIRYREFVQFVFDRQWHDVLDYAHEKGVELVGDLPIYVALDSADVWAAPEAFDLNDEHEPASVAGVPPNANDDGQRWGNPLYDWETLQETGYEWWIARLDRLFEMVDVTRLDHFKGFDEYWAIPADADSPAAGEWRDAPGYDFFETVEAKFGDLPFIAEDLGFIDQQLIDFREEFDFPGMKVPHYANWCQGGDPNQPMHYPENAVAYSATHDTNTTVGYYHSLPDEQKDCLHYNLGVDGSDIHWSMIEAVWNSNAVIALAPMQDLLGLDSHARFNTPGTAEGNWDWRCTRDGFADDVSGHLSMLTDIHIR